VAAEDILPVAVAESPTTTPYVDLSILVNVLMPSSASIIDSPLDIETVEAIDERLDQPTGE